MKKFKFNVGDLVKYISEDDSLGIVMKIQTDCFYNERYFVKWLDILMTHNNQIINIPYAYFENQIIKLIIKL